MDSEERSTLGRVLRLVPLVLLVGLLAWCTAGRRDHGGAGAPNRAELVDLMLEEGLIDSNATQDLGQVARRAGESGMNRLMYHSASSASIEALAWMVAHGADPHNIGALERGTLLQQAARRPTFERLSYFVDTLHLDPAAATPDKVTVLMVAAEHGIDLQGVRFLVGKGVKLEARDAAGRTALHYAQVKSLSALVNAGAQLNAVDGAGRTALHTAADEGRAPAVSELIRLGASVFAVDRDGNTPLHLAAPRQSEDTVDALLAAGASRATRNHRGMTARDVYLAERSNRQAYQRVDRSAKL